MYCTYYIDTHCCYPVLRHQHIPLTSHGLLPLGSNRAASESLSVTAISFSCFLFFTPRKTSLLSPCDSPLPRQSAFIRSIHPSIHHSTIIIIIIITIILVSGPLQSKVKLETAAAHLLGPPSGPLYGPPRPPDRHSPAQVFFLLFFPPGHSSSSILSTHPVTNHPLSSPFPPIKSPSRTTDICQILSCPAPFCPRKFR